MTDFKERKLKEFDKKFTRKSKGGEDKGKHMDRWFVRETTAGELKQFLSTTIDEAEKEGRKSKAKPVEPFLVEISSFSTKESYIGDCIKYAAKLIIKSLSPNK